MTHLDRALDYARKGYYVHPLCWPTPDGHCGCGYKHNDKETGKAPLAEHGAKDATRDEAQIREWWVQWPDANIGIDTKQSGIVDVASDCPECAERFKANGMARSTHYTSGGGPGRWHTHYRLPVGAPARNINKPGEYDILAAGESIPSRPISYRSPNCPTRPRGLSRCCATLSRAALAVTIWIWI